MLVLTRKCSEMIRIGDDIVIKVIKTGRNTVKIGIEAPKSVRVARAEILFHGELEVQTDEETPSSPQAATFDLDEPDLQRSRLETMRRVGGSLVPEDSKSCLVC